MSFSTDLYIVQKGSTTVRKVIGTKAGDVYVAKRFPDYLELVNSGKVWQALDGTTTVALVAKPTTTAGLTMQNPASSGKTYVVWSVMAYMNVVPASLSTVSVWHCVHKLAAAAFTRDISLQATGADAIGGLKGGQGSYTGQVILDRGATVVDDGWMPTPLQLVGNIATTDFHAKEAALVTPVVIPPSFHHSLQTTATVVTNESALGYTWAEIDTDDFI